MSGILGPDGKPAMLPSRGEEGASMTRGEANPMSRGGNPGYARSSRKEQRLDENRRLRELNTRAPTQAEAEKEIRDKMEKRATIGDLLALRQELLTVRAGDVGRVAGLADRIETLVLALSRIQEMITQEIVRDRPGIGALTPQEMSYGNEVMPTKLIGFGDVFDQAFKEAGDTIAKWRAEAEGLSEVVGNVAMLERLLSWNADPSHPPIKANCFPKRRIQQIIESEDSEVKTQLLEELGFHLRKPGDQQPISADVSEVEDRTGLYLRREYNGIPVVLRFSKPGYDPNDITGVAAGPPPGSDLSMETYVDNPELLAQYVLLLTAQSIPGAPPEPSTSHETSEVATGIAADQPEAKGGVGGGDDRTP